VTIRQLLTLGFLFFPPVVAGQSSGTYAVVKHLKLGGDGGWDYIKADAAGRRLYVSHGSKMVVVDLDRDSVLGEVGNLVGVHGAVVAPEAGRGFTSNGRDTSVTIFDARTLATISNLKVTGRNPDAIQYEPVSRRVFTMNGGSGNATAIDAASGKIVGTVDLGGGKPEAVVADGKGRMYVNIEDSARIVAFDAQTLQVTGRWSLTGCEEPTGLAIDRDHRRLFSACHNKVMAISNLDAGKVMRTLPIGENTDGAEFDPGTQLAFTSNGDGTLTVVHEETPDKFTVVANVKTQRGARTMALDEKTHRVYLSAAQYGPTPEPTKEQPRPRPPILPGTFEVLVLERR
jgi:DNA-binding beta-propeller fold protein YncE